MIMQTRTALILAGAGLFTAGVQAGTVTPVLSPPAGEKTHAEILGDIFGGVFAPDGDGFTNGSVDVMRVDDDNDQTYDFASWDAEVLASWAFAGQEFGTAADGPLISIAGRQNESASGAVSDPDGGQDIAFARFGDDFKTIDVTTNPADNPNGADHVVTYTYSMQGEPVDNTYLLFFEDSNDTSRVEDWDYNDLVVEVVGVPEPTSLALLGLGALAMLRRRR